MSDKKQETILLIDNILDMYSDQSQSWETFLPKMISEHSEMLLTSNPIEPIAYNKNGGLSSDQPRLVELLKRNQFNRLTQRAIKKSSQEGRVALTVGLIDSEFVTLGMMSSIVKYDRPVGMPYTHISGIQRFDHSLQPRLTYVEYTPNEVKFKWEPKEGIETLTAENADNLNWTLEHCTPTDWGHVPVVVIENRTTDEEDEQGWSDTENVKPLTKQLQFLWISMQREAMMAKTHIAVNKGEGSWASKRFKNANDQEKDVVKEIVLDAAILYQVKPDNYEAKDFSILQYSPNLEAYRKEFNEILFTILWQKGMIPFKDRDGKFQMTDSQMGINRNPMVMAHNLKKQNLMEGFKELIELVIYIERLEGIYDWADTEYVDIEMYVEDPALESAMKHDPAPFYKAGWTMEQIIRITQKVSPIEAHRRAIEANKQARENAIVATTITNDADVLKAIQGSRSVVSARAYKEFDAELKKADAEVKSNEVAIETAEISADSKETKEEII